MQFTLVKCNAFWWKGMTSRICTPLYISLKSWFSKMNSIPLENTYDLLVGSLSIGIPSIKLMNSEKYNFIHHFYLWARKWLKWLAWWQKCIEYVPYAVNLLQLIEMRNTQHITDNYSKFFFSCSSARPHLLKKISAS